MLTADSSLILLSTYVSFIGPFVDQHTADDLQALVTLDIYL